MQYFQYYRPSWFFRRSPFGYGADYGSEEPNWLPNQYPFGLHIGGQNLPFWYKRFRDSEKITWQNIADSVTDATYIMMACTVRQKSAIVTLWVCTLCAEQKRHKIRHRYIKAFLHLPCRTKIMEAFVSILLCYYAKKKICQCNTDFKLSSLLIKLSHNF